jgi:hypothetical protein
MRRSTIKSRTAQVVRAISAIPEEQRKVAIEQAMTKVALKVDGKREVA